VLDETRVREELLVKEVVLEQDHNGIGITIKGGADLKSPLRVDKIINHSPAHRCGQINRDDILLAVNDVDTRFKSIREIVSAQ
jgi:C-terminal processing protease CtpA/Prc